MNMKNMNYKRAAGLAVVTALFLTGCSEKESKIAFTAMDTYMELTAYGDADETLQEAKERILELEGLLSVTNPESEIYAINHAGGADISVSAYTYELLDFAYTMAARTDGALDPTIYPVVDAWGFITGEYRVSGEQALSALLERVDYTAVQLLDKAVRLPDEMELDLGAVAKGYAADAVAEIYADAGIASGLVYLGGNIQAVGSKPDGSPWRIGIQEPDGEGYVGVVSVRNAAVVTSGGYERYFTDEDGNRYWHILDPSTGKPADSGLLSVTIVTESGAYADALSTAIFVMGPDRAEAFWKEYRDFEMVLLTTDRRVLVTEGLSAAFTLENEDYPLRWID